MRITCHRDPFSAEEPRAARALFEEPGHSHGTVDRGP